MAQELIEYATELFSLIRIGRGEVLAKRLFGGYGLSIDGNTFAIIADGQLFLKADAQTAETFEAAGCAILSYEAAGETRYLNYYLPPERALESAAAMQPWAELAWAAALRAAERRNRSGGRNKRR